MTALLRPVKTIPILGSEACFCLDVCPLSTMNDVSVHFH